MPLMGLTAAELILKVTLIPIIQQAYTLQYMGGGGPNAGVIAAAVQKAAIQFAKDTAGPVAKAIHKFFIEAKIDISVLGTIIAPPLPPVLPGGPCVGSIPAAQVKIM